MPVPFVLVPGLVTLTGPATVKAKLTEPVRLAESLTVTVAVVLPAVVGVPVIAPVEALMLSPAGSPAADQVNGPLPPDTVMVCDAGVPTVPVRLPGLVTVGLAVTDQENDEVAVRPPASFAVTVTLVVPAADGVPETTPLLETVKPVGSPVAVQVYGVVPPVADSVSVAAWPVVDC